MQKIAILAASESSMCLLFSGLQIEWKDQSPLCVNGDKTDLDLSICSANTDINAEKAEQTDLERLV